MYEFSVFFFLTSLFCSTPCRKPHNLMCTSNASFPHVAHSNRYNVVDESPDGITLEDGMVRADVIMKGSGEKISLRQHHPTAGRAAWKNVVHGNAMSFFDVYKANAGADVTAIEERFTALHEAAKAAQP